MNEMSKNAPPGLADKLYRLVLVLAAAMVFGLFAYWALPDVTPFVGETGAALWSWGLIVVGGIGAHWLLPRTGMTPVSGVLFAVLTSTVLAVFMTLILTVAVLPVERDEIPMMLFALGLTMLAFSGLVFVPLHLLRKQLGRFEVFLTVFAGMGIPAGLVMFLRPVDPNDILGDLMLASFLSLIGGCSAVGFSIAAAWHRNSRSAGT